MEKENTQKLKVSNLFAETFKNFNVTSQKNNMETLSRKELMLLLIKSLDTFDEENPITIENFRPYKDELNLIFSHQNDEDTTDIDLLHLSNITNEKYIDSDYITDELGEKLKSYTEQEARVIRRELGIDKIFENE